VYNSHNLLGLFGSNQQQSELPHQPLNVLWVVTRGFLSTKFSKEFGEQHTAKLKELKTIKNQLQSKHRPRFVTTNYINKHVLLPVSNAHYCVFLVVIPLGSETPSFAHLAVVRYRGFLPRRAQKDRFTYRDPTPRRCFYHTSP
jgi:hypothetical protein